MSIDKLRTTMEEKYRELTHNLDDLQRSFSSVTQEYITESRFNSQQANSNIEITELVSEIINTGLKVQHSGAEIKDAVNRHRKNIIEQAIFKISSKIINDVIVVEAEKDRFKVCKIEDILIAGVSAQAIKNKDNTKMLEILGSFNGGGDNTKNVAANFSEFIENSFLELNSNDNSGLIFLDLFYLSFKKQDESKPLVSVPIFEAIISYA